MKPPKDGTMIIATFKNSAPLVAMWNGAELDWAVAEPAVGMYQGVWDDCYFETEHYAEEELVAWWPMEGP